MSESDPLEQFRPPKGVIPDPFKPEAVDPKKLPRPLRSPYRLFLWTLKNPKRRRLYYNISRATLVIGMVILVTFSILPELTGSSLAAQDNLTQTQNYIVGPANLTGPSGLVEGEDVILGNFSVVSPAGAQVEFYILPQVAGSWINETSQAVYTSGGYVSSYHFQWSADLTMIYHFLLFNPSGNGSVTVYWSSQYVSSEPPA
jgi:hypothetical protein